ncbi:MAG: response regulator [Chitinophagaceae bacterium]|nr:response regulator [Chitinophagaceae bacterium]
MKTSLFKVLIVDDEIDICYLLSGILQQKDFKTAYANSLSEATIALQKDTPDIIFLDNHLPDGLGIDYIRHVKEVCPLTCVIMITAHDSMIEKNKALNNGADAFLGKPLTRDLIYTSIQKFIVPRPML